MTEKRRKDILISALEEAKVKLQKKIKNTQLSKCKSETIYTNTIV